MALKPDQKTALAQFTTAAKAIIFNAERFKPMLKLMDTKSGAIQAVQAVMSGIEQKKPIPPDIAMLLAINIYVLLVDMAQDATGMKADKGIVQGVIAALMKTTLDSHGKARPQQARPAPQQATQQPQQTQQTQPQPAQPPAGLINQGV